MASRGTTASEAGGWDWFRPVGPWDVPLDHLPFSPPLPSSFRHINVGSDFQAELPELQTRPPSEDEEPASLVWKPLEDDDSDMEKPDRGSRQAFLPPLRCSGLENAHCLVKRQHFACSASLLVSPLFPRGSARGKENALFLQQSRKKNSFPAL